MATTRIRKRPVKEATPSTDAARNTVESETLPAPDEIRAAREAAGLTQSEAAELVHLSAPNRWAAYEQGAWRIDAARWELFKIKTAHFVEFKRLMERRTTRRPRGRPRSSVASTVQKPRAKRAIGKT